MFYAQVTENAYQHCLQSLNLPEHLYNSSTEQLVVWGKPDQMLETHRSENGA